MRENGKKTKMPLLRVPRVISLSIIPPSPSARPPPARTLPCPALCHGHTLLAVVVWLVLATAAAATHMEATVLLGFLGSARRAGAGGWSWVGTDGSAVAGSARQAARHVLHADARATAGAIVVGTGRRRGTVAGNGGGRRPLAAPEKPRGGGGGGGSRGLAARGREGGGLAGA